MCVDICGRIMEKVGVLGKFMRGTVYLFRCIKTAGGRVRLFCGDIFLPFNSKCKYDSTLDV